MKIHDFDGFPNPARIRMALAEKGATQNIKFVSVNVPAGEHRQPAFLAKNPSGAVPVLELDCGTCISECTAITEYIDHAFEGTNLTGRDAKERAVIHMMQRRAEQQVLDAVAAFFHHATPGLGPDIETHQLPGWGEHQGRLAVTGMRYFDELLQNQSWVAGQNFSMADITLYAGLSFADFAGVAIPDECQALKAWRERVAARPAHAA